MQAKLVVVSGRANRREIAINLPLTIGRGKGQRLAILHPTVSRQHCELFERDGLVWVRDLGSSNGTFIGDARVTESALKPGERLTVGPLVFEAVYELKNGAAPKPKTPARQTAKKQAAPKLEQALVQETVVEPPSEFTPAELAMEPPVKAAEKTSLNPALASNVHNDLLDLGDDLPLADDLDLDLSDDLAPANKPAVDSDNDRQQDESNIATGEPADELDSLNIDAGSNDDLEFDLKPEEADAELGSRNEASSEPAWSDDDLDLELASLEPTASATVNEPSSIDAVVEDASPPFEFEGQPSGEIESDEPKESAAAPLANMRDDESSREIIENPLENDDLDLDLGLDLDEQFHAQEDGAPADAWTDADLSQEASLTEPADDLDIDLSPDRTDEPFAEPEPATAEEPPSAMLEGTGPADDWLLDLTESPSGAPDLASDALVDASPEVQNDAAKSEAENDPWAEIEDSAVTGPAVSDPDDQPSQPSPALDPGELSLPVDDLEDLPLDELDDGPAAALPIASELAADDSPALLSTADDAIDKPALVEPAAEPASLTVEDSDFLELISEDLPGDASPLTIDEEPSSSNLGGDIHIDSDLSQVSSDENAAALLAAGPNVRADDATEASLAAAEDSLFLQPPADNSDSSNSLADVSQIDELEPLLALEDQANDQFGQPVGITANTDAAAIKADQPPMLDELEPLTSIERQDNDAVDAFDLDDLEAIPADQIADLDATQLSQAQPAANEAFKRDVVSAVSDELEMISDSESDLLNLDLDLPEVQGEEAPPSEEPLVPLNQAADEFGQPEPLKPVLALEPTDEEFAAPHSSEPLPPESELPGAAEPSDMLVEDLEIEAMNLLGTDSLGTDLPETEDQSGPGNAASNRPALRIAQFDEQEPAEATPANLEDDLAAIEDFDLSDDEPLVFEEEDDSLLLIDADSEAGPEPLDAPDEQPSDAAAGATATDQQFGPALPAADLPSTESALKGKKPLLGFLSRSQESDVAAKPESPDAVVAKLAHRQNVDEPPAGVEDLAPAGEEVEATPEVIVGDDDLELLLADETEPLLLEEGSAELEPFELRSEVESAPLESDFEEPMSLASDEALILEEDDSGALEVLDKPGADVPDSQPLQAKATADEPAPAGKRRGWWPFSRAKAAKKGAEKSEIPQSVETSTVDDLELQLEESEDISFDETDSTTASESNQTVDASHANGASSATEITDADLDEFLKDL